MAKPRKTKVAQDELANLLPDLQPLIDQWQAETDRMVDAFCGDWNARIAAMPYFNVPVFELEELEIPESFL
jgi:hypothetical protein